MCKLIFPVSYSIGYLRGCVGLQVHQTRHLPPPGGCCFRCLSERALSHALNKNLINKCCKTRKFISMDFSIVNYKCRFGENSDAIYHLSGIIIRKTSNE